MRLQFPLLLGLLGLVLFPFFVGAESPARRFCTGDEDNCLREMAFDDDLQFVEIAKLAPNGIAAGDAFGWYGGISGDTAVFTAYLDDDNGPDSGSAYVFARDEGGADNWGLIKKLLPADGISGDQFGYSADMDQDTIVIGAYLNSDLGFRAGAAYVFERNFGGPENWGLVKKLYAGDGEALDFFGRAVSIQSDTIVVGAIRDNDNGNNSGSVYVFGRNSGGSDNWGQTAKLISSQGSPDDQFGHSVDLDGNRLVIGEVFNDSSGLIKQGAAYLFERESITSTNWTENKMFTAFDGAAEDTYGGWVAISVETIAIGAVRDDDKGSMSGSAYVYERNQGGPDNWGLVNKLVPANGVPGGRFGHVAIQGDLLAIGSPGGETTLSATGLVYIYERENGASQNWGLKQQVVASDADIGDEFGHYLGLDGDTLIVGASKKDIGGIDSGSAYIFQLKEPIIPTVSPSPTITPSPSASSTASPSPFPSATVTPSPSKTPTPIVPDFWIYLPIIEATD